MLSNRRWFGWDMIVGICTLYVNVLMLLPFWSCWKPTRMVGELLEWASPIKKRGCANPHILCLKQIK